MLTIKRTGYSDYLDGSGNIKMLVIGGPDAGKTRSSSYWPKPFFIDCENGRGSLADRKMPYVECHSSADALDALAYLKGMERIPKKEREHQTVVFDTLDSFQRSVKDEWLQATKAGAFKGYDAWGYLDTKMTMLMTRLLNLDYNVLVLCHYKDKTLKDDDGKESRELMLQLQGDIKDTAFNDFSLVGWLGTYWETDGDKGRVEKRGLTFTKTMERPFLKDRFAILPTWVPITFAESDYQQIYNAFLAQLDERDLPDTEIVGEIPTATPEQVARPANVVAPLIGGPVPAGTPSELPVHEMSKPQLLTVVQVEGIKVKGNALKAELAEAILAHRAAVKAQAPVFEPQVDAVSASEPAAGEGNAKLEENSGPAVLEISTAEKVNAQFDAAEKAAAEFAAEPTVEAVVTQLPATIISDTVPAPPTVLSAPPDFMSGKCAECGKALADQTRDYVRLSFIKFRRGYLCDTHFEAARAAAR